jgi:hypothetical protein
MTQGYEVHAADVEAGAALQSLQCRLHVLDVGRPTEKYDPRADDY